MTSTPVKGVDPLMNYVRTKRQAGKSNGLSDQFTDAFGKASGQSGKNGMIFSETAVPGGLAAQQTSPVRTDNGAARPESDRTQAVKEKQADKKPQKTRKPDGDKGMADAVEKAGGELVEKVADELGISVEQVQEAMEEMGLTMADLMDAELLTQLVLNLEGADMLSLVTDEGLYQSLQNLLGEAAQTVQTLQSGLNLTDEELKAVLEQAKALEKQPETGQEAAGPQTQEGLSVQEEGPQLSEGQKDYTVIVEQNGKNVEISVKKDESGRTQSTETNAEEIPSAKTEEAVPKTQTKENASHKDASSGQNGSGGAAQTNMLLEHLLNRENPVSTNAAFDAAMAQRTADTQDIMNQIMDYMRVQVKADLTQMEIQLHPASLGTVNINITSKEGVITAQLLTQNEAVKAAVESQIVQLKNSFEEQGLKVEAVEVAVDNHSFDRSLGGESSGQEQTGEEKKKGTRRINLNELNPEEESLLDDAEQIAVEMMASDGNTVDYTA